MPSQMIMPVHMKPTQSLAAPGATWERQQSTSLASMGMFCAGPTGTGARSLAVLALGEGTEVLQSCEPYSSLPSKARAREPWVDGWSVKGK